MSAMHLELPELALQLEVDDWAHGLRCWRIEQGERHLVASHLPFTMEQLATLVETQDWFRHLPPELCQCVTPYAEIAPRLLSLACRNKACLELLLCRPTLLFLAAISSPFDDDPIIEALEQGQRALLSRLGFVSGRSTLRFIDRLDLDFSSEWQRNRLMFVLRYGHSQFYHVKRITPALLFLDQLHPKLTGSRLAATMIDDYKKRIFYKRLIQIMNACSRDGAGAVFSDWRKLRNANGAQTAELVGLRWRLQQWQLRQLHALIGYAGSAFLPKPLLPDLPWLKGMKKLHQLVRLQRHFYPAYASGVWLYEALLGSLIIYRMTTLADGVVILRRSRNVHSASYSKALYLENVILFNGQAVSDEVAHKIKMWVDHYRLIQEDSSKISYEATE